MTTVQIQRSIEHYSRENGLNRYFMNMMTRMVKYRLNHMHGVFSDVAVSRKITSLTQDGLKVILEGDNYNDHLIATSDDPETLKENIKKAKNKYVVAGEVVSVLAAQYHFSYLMENIIKSGGEIPLTENQLKLFNEDAWALVSKHIEAVYDILANEDEVYERINAFLVCELTKTAENNAEYMTHPLNMKRIYSKLGYDGVLMTSRFHTFSLTLAQKAIEANEKPNDYDSE